MNVLITGARGFAGRNLTEALKCLRDGKDRTRPGLEIGQIFEYDRDSTPEELDRYCREADFVLHYAGVNRPKKAEESFSGNPEFTETLLSALRRHGSRAPVLLSSSVQATLSGRFGDSEYGRSKLAGEELVFAYGAETGIPVYVYRFTNLVGKWARPNYNSAVVTFCHNIARDLPITVNDPSVMMELLFIDDMIDEVLNCMEGRPHRCDYPKTGEVLDGVTYDGVTPRPRPDGRYCRAAVTHKARLGEIVSMLRTFHDQPKDLIIPRIAPGSLEKKLYSMYLSYLPAEKAAFDLKMNRDERGSFTELIRTADHGQVSVNITRPGVTKGQHWHNTKWEFFIVVAGHGRIRERRIGSEEVFEFDVSGNRIQAVHMLPGYTHEITNLSDTEDLVTVMWANELFDPDRPDTFREEV